MCRHWKEVMRITGKELNLAEDAFKLQHLLDCKLLKVRDDMEELTNSAVKEEQIEGKLATVSLDWAEQNLVFSDYKTRGPMILKVSRDSFLLTGNVPCLTHLLASYIVGVTASLPMHYICFEIAHVHEVCCIYGLFVHLTHQPLLMCFLLCTG